jgi:predicted amidohydrolase YtcJ
MIPDLIILNGKLITKLITFDQAQASAAALAIAGGIIQSVGKESDIRPQAGPSTRIIDAGGHTVLPGFIDSHVHLFQGSVELDALNLHAVQGFDHLAEAIQAYVIARPDNSFILATAADYDIIGPGQGADRHILDRIISDRPFAMIAADHHTVWANTRALEAAGILHGGPVPAGCEIKMGADGKATGMLVEPGAYGAVIAQAPTGGREFAGLVTGADPIPPASASERAIDCEVLKRGLSHCAAQGITTLHNMDGNFYQLELLHRLEEQEELICRVEVPFHLKPANPLERLAEAEEMRRQYFSERLWCNRVKMFMDGVIESYTGLMLAPYPDQPETNGQALFAPKHFNEACIRADALGFQIATHAIGDLAVRRTLDGYAAAQRANGKRDSRHRIEHIEVIHPNDLPRFAELGVMASMQPLHAPAGGFFEPPVPGTFLREEQIPYAYAWNKVRGAGARLSFSTDWPVVPVDVMPTIKGAVAPKTLGGAWPDSAQTLHQALASYTRDGAFVEFSENRKGVLKPGLIADVVIMSDDLESMPLDTLDQAHAEMTICGGRITYES